MRRTRSAGVIILGWAFILFSALFWLLLSRKMSVLYGGLFFLREAMPSAEKFFSAIFSFVTVEAWLVIALFFVTGLGILTLKRWAYYLALCIPFLFVTEAILSTWLLGLPIVTVTHAVHAVLYVCLVFFLTRKNVAGQFKADFATAGGKKSGPGKFVIVASCLVLLISGIPPIAWSVMMYATFKPKPNVTLTSRQVRYPSGKSAFITDTCVPREVFTYRIAIPKDFKIRSVYPGSGESGWGLTFVKQEDAQTQAFIILESASYWNLFGGLRRAFGFKNTYDFLSRLYRTNWSPLYFFIKQLTMPFHVKGIDEATAPGWKGFVVHIENEGNYCYDAVLYNAMRDTWVNVLVISKEEVLTRAQAKRILASVEFQNAPLDGAEYFEKGKAALTRADFLSATLDFLNACYFSHHAPEYAYYLADALVKLPGGATRAIRKESARTLLRHCLKHDPSLQKAAILLDSLEEKSQ